MKQFLKKLIGFSILAIFIGFLCANVLVFLVSIIFSALIDWLFHLLKLV